MLNNFNIQDHHYVVLIVKVYNDNFLNNVNFEDDKLRSVIELIKTEIISTKNILPPSKDVVVKVCSEIGIYLPNMQRGAFQQSKSSDNI